MKNKPPYTEKDLLEGMTASTAHADELAQLSEAELIDIVDEQLKETSMMLKTKKKVMKNKKTIGEMLSMDGVEDIEFTPQPLD